MSIVFCVRQNQHLACTYWLDPWENGTLFLYVYSCHRDGILS